MYDNRQRFEARAFLLLLAASSILFGWLLLPFFDGARRIMGFAIGMDTTEDYVFNFSINAPFDDVEGFQLTFPEDSGMTFQAGSKYQVFGEK